MDDDLENIHMMEDRIQSDFEAFDAAHPEVYTHFKFFANTMLMKGFDHGSAKLIMERIRWEMGVELNRDPVKLNNNYSSRYARKFEAEFPHCDGFFRKRKLHPISANSTRFTDPVYEA